MGHVTLVGMVGKLVTSRAAWKRTGGPSGSLCVRIFSIMLKLTAAGCGEAELGAPTEDRRARIQSWEQLEPQQAPQKDPAGAERHEGPDEVHVFASVVGGKKKRGERSG